MSTQTDTKPTVEQIKSDLRNFTGTSQYYRARFPLVKEDIIYTDGVQYVAETCGAVWMLSVIASYQLEEKVQGQRFQVHSFKRTEGDSFRYELHDGNYNVLATQDIEYSDFPLDEIEFWASHEGDRIIIYLPSEH